MSNDGAFKKQASKAKFGKRGKGKKGSSQPETETEEEEVFNLRKRCTEEAPATGTQPSRETNGGEALKFSEMPLSRRTIAALTNAKLGTNSPSLTVIP